MSPLPSADEPQPHADEPELTAEAVGAELEAWMGAGRPDTATLAGVYSGLMARRSPQCPSPGEGPVNDWNTWATLPEGCVTPGGDEWVGKAVGEYACAGDLAAGSLHVGALVSFTVDGPAGAATFGGEFLHTCSWTGTGGECAGGVTGNFAAEGQPAPFESGFVAAFFVNEVWSGADRTVVLDGGVTSGALTLRFDALEVAPSGAVGVLGLREPSGRWHELEFSGGWCGRLRFDTVDEGELCVDLGAWSGPLARLEAECWPS